MIFVDANGDKLDLSFAENIVKLNKKENSRFKGQYEFFGGLTTSKLRNLMSLVNNIYVKIHNSQTLHLSDDVIDELNYIKVKFYYEAGREKSVKTFIDQTQIISIIDQVIKAKTKKSLIDFCRFFEGLVAYSKYYGMGDK